MKITEEASALLKASRANFIARDIMTHLTHCKFELDNLGSGKKVINVPSFFQDKEGEKVMKDVESIVFDIANRSLSGEMFQAQGNMTRQVNLIDEINKRITLKSIADIVRDDNLHADFKSCIAKFKAKINERIKSNFVGDIRTKYQDQLTKVANIEKFMREVTKEFDVETFLKNKGTNAQSYVPNFELLETDNLEGATSGGAMCMIYAQIFKDENSVQDYYRWGRYAGEKFADSADLFSTEKTDPKMSGIILHYTVGMNSDTAPLPFYSDESAELHEMGADSHEAIPKYKMNMELSSFLPYSLVQNFDLANFNAAYQQVDWQQPHSWDALVDAICENDINIFKVKINGTKADNLQECVERLEDLTKQFQKSIDAFTDQVTRHVSNIEVYIKGGQIIRTVTRELDKTKLFDGLDDSSLFRDFTELSFMMCKLQSFGAKAIKSWIAKNSDNLDQFKNFAENFSSLNPHKIAASSHFFVCKEQGDIFCMVPQSSLAYHAGISSFAHDEFLNEKTVGVEIESLGDDDVPSSVSQRSSVSELSKVLMDDGYAPEYDIHKGWVLTHQQIAIQKADPNLKTYLFDYKEQCDSVGTKDQQTVLQSAKTMMDLLNIKSDQFITFGSVGQTVFLVDDEETCQIRKFLSCEFKFDDQKCDGVVVIGNSTDPVKLPYELAYVFLSTYDASVTYADFVQEISEGNDSKGFLKVIGNVVVTFNKNISLICDVEVHDIVRVVGEDGEKIAEVGDASYHVYNGTVLLAAANLKNIVTKEVYNNFGKLDGIARANKESEASDSEQLSVLCSDHNKAILWALDNIKLDDGEVVGSDYLNEYFLIL